MFAARIQRERKPSIPLSSSSDRVRLGSRAPPERAASGSWLPLRGNLRSAGTAAPGAGAPAGPRFRLTAISAGASPPVRLQSAGWSMLVHAGLALVVLAGMLLSPQDVQEPDQPAELDLVIGTNAMNTGGAATPVAAPQPPATATPPAPPVPRVAPQTAAAPPQAEPPPQPPPAPEAAPAPQAAPQGGQPIAAQTGRLLASPDGTVATPPPPSAEVPQPDARPQVRDMPPAPAVQPPPAQATASQTPVTKTPAAQVPVPQSPPAPEQAHEQAQAAAQPPMPQSAPGGAATPDAAPADAPPDVRMGEGIAGLYAEIEDIGRIHRAEPETGNVPPEYPLEAARRGEQGSVTLRIYIAADGGVLHVDVAQSSGWPILDRAARDRIATWHFHPATRDGKPVAAVEEQTIRFAP